MREDLREGADAGADRRRALGAVGILAAGALVIGAACWANRDTMWRGVLAKTLSQADLAAGAGCAPFIGNDIPELVSAVRQNFADADSVRPTETLMFDRNSQEARVQTSVFGADRSAVAVDMKFAARNKSGVMQFFTAGASLDPKICDVKLLTIVDDAGKVVLINLPTPAQEP
ncbi:hypothetical protein AQZ49_01745 [Novosphingobium sp. FSW06-99]|nr:hypothetical protein AQZ49_01745 [Novosphingobium sp. FSW06-99]